jgi:hypothetical protein
MAVRAFYPSASRSHNKDWGVLMAIRLADRIPVDRIQKQAKPVDVGRLLMVLVVGFFYLCGFTARKVTLVLGMGLGWMLAATRTGWQDAAKPAEERRRGLA